jgi:ATP-dependent RNA helicase MSS116
MLGTIRRFGVSSALRASAPRSISRCASQLPKWQAPSTLSSLSATRSLHSSFPRFSAAAAAEASTEQAEFTKPQRITEFSALAEEGLVDKAIMKNIIQADRMNLKTMTEVQSLTLHEIVKGDDM